MIHVLIERRIAEGLETTYDRTAHEVFQQAYHAQGFISGESFNDLKRPNRRYMIAKWRTAQDWQNWKHSDERKRIMDRVNPILEEQERITLLEH